MAVLMLMCKIKDNNCAIIIIVLFATLISGCATYKTSPLQRPVWEDTTALLKDIRGNAQNLSLQQIKDALISNSLKLTTFRANADITLTTPELKAPIRCTGLILYQAPGSFRAIGSKFATTLFDISSDGENFWLNVPLENKVYTGTCNAFHRIEALGVNIFPGDMTNLFNHKKILEERASTMETWPAFWLVHMMEMVGAGVNIKGNLLIDRVNADVVRCELFSPDGSVRLQAVFTNYATYKECRIPQRIDVRWPAYDTTLSLIFSNATVNSAFAPKIFAPAVASGAQIIRLD